jgi:hypothetical protein
MALLFKKNTEGGVDPVDSTSLARAKVVDLITLPPDVPGTNCGNCSWARPHPSAVAQHWCAHPRVLQPITPRMCCALWDNAGVRRPWG